jgi:alkylated DNA repair dioxygenase AlkB
MRFLFPTDVAEQDVPPIPGLSYLSSYITEREEIGLLAAIDEQPWDTSWERRRQPYGWSYGRDGVSPPIPDWGQRLAERMASEGISQRVFDQMLINEYLPGQGIALHRDYEPFDLTVVSLSLLSPCVMDFRHLKDRCRTSLLLEPRSLLILSDEARYDWQHGIARRKNDRWQGKLIRRSRRLSITFRLAKQKA